MPNIFMQILYAIILHVLHIVNVITFLNSFFFLVSGDGRSEVDNSLVVSMEINGIMYQGVLFAQHPRRL